ncbi:hypothetical protein PF66_00260 [Pseudomonas asplenii]|uniref:Uncharacterized protein n=1 Tax=Pseudomonas asplenii TaxID=53407 RepID=A0A0N0E684_9PSED|nr:hypothetical protein PF66_00260 [Pseudomonas fuscovaginae]KPA98119.1 hypothetical protein PF70_01759 [Pseudomonas fuscovaginae]
MIIVGVGLAREAFAALEDAFAGKSAPTVQGAVP